MPKLCPTPDPRTLQWCPSEFFEPSTSRGQLENDDLHKISLISPTGRHKPSNMPNKKWKVEKLDYWPDNGTKALKSWTMKPKLRKTVLLYPKNNSFWLMQFTWKFSNAAVDKTEGNVCRKVCHLSRRDMWMNVRWSSYRSRECVRTNRCFIIISDTRPVCGFQKFWNKKVSPEKKIKMKFFNVTCRCVVARKMWELSRNFFSWKSLQRRMLNDK